MGLGILQRIFPPYQRNIVFAVCGVHILFFAVILAIHQTFWLLSTQIFPTAYEMFDDTVNRAPEFAWNKTIRRQLDRYQLVLTVSWAIACLAIGISMSCIIPQFCKSEVAKGKEMDLCIRQPCIPCILFPLFVLANLLLAACLLTEWMLFPADDRLFHNLFNGAIKEEAFLTSFEDNLNCMSDEDKEGVDWKCDRVIERAILNSNWLVPMLIAQLALALLSLLACLIFNDQKKLLKKLIRMLEDDEMD